MDSGLVGVHRANTIPIRRTQLSIRDVQLALSDAQITIRNWRQRHSDPTEHETRRSLIDPVLKALGWSVQYGRGNNRGPCITEYFPYEDESLRADYAMFSDDGEEAIIIEAKRFVYDTRDHYHQLEDYCLEAHGIRAALTNGEYWNILVFDQNGIAHEEKPIGLLWRDQRETTQRLYDLLSRDRNRGGQNRRIRWKA